MPATNFVVESWTYLAINLVVVAFRLGSRWYTLGLRGLAIDDFLMAVAGLLYTAETATAYYVSAYWFGLANNRIGFVIVPISFFITFLTILFGCFPISKHWQINPDPGNFCQPAVSKLQAYTLITMNLSTDFYIMAIPLPMIWGTRMGLRKKFGLLLMFCGGIFTTVAGLLRCILILTSGAAGPEQAGEWSCRESFIAVFVSNVPLIFPPIHRACRKLAGMSTTTGGESKSKSKSYRLGDLTVSTKRNKKFKHPLSIPDETVMQHTAYERYGSDEMIVIPEEEAGATQKKINDSNSDAQSSVKGGDIRVTTQWDIQSNTEDRSRIENFGKERHTRMFSQTQTRSR
ncbi:hypothetical protein B7463_g2078, partial [Scytalidium lignicola]